MTTVPLCMIFKRSKHDLTLLFEHDLTLLLEHDLTLLLEHDLTLLFEHDLTLLLEQAAISTRSEIKMLTIPMYIYMMETAREHLVGPLSVSSELSIGGLRSMVRGSPLIYVCVKHVSANV